ncbi:conjugative transposon protein TraM [Butyricimonas sp.]|uniref:conjugative transposon protein TraM n=1 Tax=Butyricimonas sp. TaxID=1969738 RepID=UPI0025BD12DA|nr:conjugative transposon protein TraM [Butyricimonas sp.]
MSNKDTSKQLTPRQIQQRKKMLVYPLLFVVFGVCMYIIFAPASQETLDDEKVNGYNVEIPSPRSDEIIEDKIYAYKVEMQKRKQEEKVKTLEDYAFLLQGEKGEPENLFGEPVKKAEEPGSKMQSSVSTYQKMNREMQSFYQPSHKEDREKENLQRQVEQLQQQLQDIQAQPDPHVIMEESYKLAAKYLNPAQVEQSASTPVQNNQHEDNYVTVEPERENVISMLGEMSDSVFIKSLEGKRNLGFNTIGTNKLIQRNTIRACINSDQILLFGENTGSQKVQLRLLENIRVGNLVIPRNSLVTGIAKLSSERLEITINTIEYLGNIIPVSLNVSDTDGLSGLNCPGSVERNTAKDIGGNIGGSVGTSINLGSNAGEQVVADVSRSVIQGVTNYIGKKIKMVKVSLKANYNVLIVNTK